MLSSEEINKKYEELKPKYEELKSKHDDLKRSNEEMKQGIEKYNQELGKELDSATAMIGEKSQKLDTFFKCLKTHRIFPGVFCRESAKQLQDKEAGLKISLAMNLIDKKPISPTTDETFHINERRTELCFNSYRLIGTSVDFFEFYNKNPFRVLSFKKKVDTREIITEQTQLYQKCVRLQQGHSYR